MVEQNLEGRQREALLNFATNSSLEEVSSTFCVWILSHLTSALISKPLTFNAFNSPDAIVASFLPFHVFLPFVDGLLPLIFLHVLFFGRSHEGHPFICMVLVVLTFDYSIAATRIAIVVCRKFVYLLLRSHEIRTGLMC
jgi:hypothetical protein